MVNCTQNPQSQQMRFQLNSKRFSNVKDGSINGNAVQAATLNQPAKGTQSAKGQQHQFNTHQQ